MINKAGIVLVTDDPILAAVVSSALSVPGQYFSVFEAPRMQRPDADREIITMMNSMRRVHAQLILYGGVEESVSEEVARHWDIPYKHIGSIEEFQEQLDDLLPVEGLTNANAAEKLYNFRAGNKSSNRLAVVIQNTHEVDSIIAANYAIARNANFFMVNIPEGYLQQVNEKLNKMAGVHDVDIRKIDLQALIDEFKALLPEEDMSSYSKILFITEGFPLGISVPAVPTAHLPKLRVGLTIAANLGEYSIALEHKHAFNGTFLNLPDKIIKSDVEHESMSKALLRTFGLVKLEDMKDAKLSELEVEVFPYDILYIATHGSQVEAELNTYDFETSDGVKHEMVVSLGLGPTATLHKIESVDGIVKDSEDWKDEQINVWSEYSENVPKKGKKLTPIKTERTLLEMRSLQFDPNSGGMGSGNTFQVLSGGYLPLVIVNACGSWNDLSGSFIFAGCSSYIGTVLPVSNSIAEAYALKFFENLFDQELINVAHSAKESLKDDYEKSLYVFTGTFESKFDFGSSKDDPSGIDVLKRRIPIEIQKIEDRVKELDGKENANIVEAYKVQAMYLTYELSRFENVVDSVDKQT